MGFSKHVAIFALLLAASAQLCFASAELDGNIAKYNTMVSNRMNGWYETAAIAIMICVLFNGLVYMAGQAFESEHLKRYATSEFLQVTASTMMIFFAVALLFTVSSGGGANKSSAMDFVGYVLGTGGSTINCAATPGGKFIIWSGDDTFGAGPLGAFKCKVQEKIDALEQAYNNVEQTNRANERALSWCISLFGAPVWCNSWDLSQHKQVEQSHLMAAKIVGLLPPLHAQFVLAEYLQKNMLTVFLPFGLVLRIFPLTRGVGGLFIAIAVGFFFIWPTFFVLSDPTFVKKDAAVQDRLQGVCFTGFKSTAVVLDGQILSGNAEASSLAVNDAAALVFELTVSALFYPFVALVLTLAFIRAMAPLLGGDLGELMKMVARLG